MSERVSEEEIKKAIMREIGKSIWGITQAELAELTGFHRNTISKYLNMLLHELRVAKKTYGRTEVWFLSSETLERRLLAPRSILMQTAYAIQEIYGLTEKSRRFVMDLIRKMIERPGKTVNFKKMWDSEDNSLESFKKITGELKNHMPLFLFHIEIECKPNIDDSNKGQFIVNNCLCEGMKNYALGCQFIAGFIKAGSERLFEIDLEVKETKCACDIENSSQCVFNYIITSKTSKK
ncbi:MAG: hypothetical protein ACTSYA_11025 [Candidatus Kariarchaeaceae archaeon]